MMESSPERRPTLKCSLEDVLSYQNEDVINRFAEDYRISEVDAAEIFLEMKRWLWLCARQKVRVDIGQAQFFSLPLFNEAKAIDLMWHTFLIYTFDYAQFCERYFGFFLHHQPRSKAERKAWLEKIEQNQVEAWQERRDSLRKVYEYLYDEVGPEVLAKWCEDFPRRFDF